MEKINFEDGQLVSPASVNIEGETYPIKEAEYESPTPLSAHVLNKLQTNIETEINNIQAELSKQLQSIYSVKIAQAITQNTNYELPGTYVVESNMELYMEGILLVKDMDYIEVGDTGETSNIIQFKNWTVKAGYILVQKVKGQSIRIYSKEEAIEAVEQLWIQEHNTIDNISVRSETQNANKDYIVRVGNSTTGETMQWYTVNRLTLEIESGWIE